MMRSLATRSLITIPLLTSGSVAVIAVALFAAGVHTNLADALAAGIIGCVSGILGVLPIICGRPKDQVDAPQLALIGSVLHILSTVAMAGTLILLHAVVLDSMVALWLIAGYWISLIVTISQLRRLILAVPNSAILKAGE